MKLKEIIEANMYPIDHYDPSGNTGPVTVDPDKVDELLDPKGTKYSKLEKNDKADRSKRLRTKYKVAKSVRSEPKSNIHVVSDNTDLTGSGANSAMNGIIK